MKRVQPSLLRPTGTGPIGHKETIEGHTPWHDERVVVHYELIQQMQDKTMKKITDN